MEERFLIDGVPCRRIHFAGVFGTPLAGRAPAFKTEVACEAFVPCEPDALEPNESFAGARPVAHGSYPDLRICGNDVDDYTIHTGALGSWYDHTQKACTTGGAFSFDNLSTAPGNRYILVVPTSSTSEEGSYGSDSTGTERPVSALPCQPDQDLVACP